MSQNRTVAGHFARRFLVTPEVGWRFSSFAGSGDVAEWLRQGPAKPSTWVRFPASPRFFATPNRGSRFSLPDGVRGGVMVKVPRAVLGAVMAVALAVTVAACSCGPTYKSQCESQGSTYIYSKEQPGDDNDGSCVKPGSTALPRGTAATTTEEPSTTEESTTTEAASTSTIAAVATATSAAPTTPVKTSAAPLATTVAPTTTVVQTSSTRPASTTNAPPTTVAQTTTTRPSSTTSTTNPPPTTVAQTTTTARPTTTAPRATSTTEVL